MAEERAAKLKLKRRKAGSCTAPSQPPPERPKPAAPQPEESLIASSCWFERKELNELDNVWKLVLNAAYPDLKSQNWETMPCLPEFLQKLSEKDKAMNTQVFQVGLKEFEWTPFPSLTGEEKVHSVNSDLQQMFGSIPDHQNTVVPHQKLIPALPARSKPTTHNTTENLRVEQCTQSSHEMSRKENAEMPKRSKIRIPTQHSQKRGNMSVSVDVHGPPHATSQSHKKAPGFERLFKTNSQNEKKEIEGESSKAKQPNLGIVCDVSVVEVGQCSMDIPPEIINKSTSSLQSCPMCSLQFAERLTPLDIDSHLAKCLSESTEDIMW